MGDFVEYTEPVWRNLNMRDLKVDEAYIYFNSDYNHTTYIYTLSDECYTCPYTRASILQPSHELGFSDKGGVLRVNVAHSLKVKLMDADVGRYAFENQTALCTLEQISIQEFGVYNVTLNYNGTCSFATDKAGVNIYLSLLSVVVLVAVILSAIKIAWCAWRTYRYNGCATAAATAQTDAAATTQMSKQRMQSLDAFRGIAIVLMVFVNSGGGAYWWIEHAPWNGLHLADVVFPSFLWIMGVCIPISVKSQVTRGDEKSKICGRIVWRSIKLFLIGICLNSINGPQLEKLRIMGVLQRFGVTFLVCGVLHACFSRKDYTARISQPIWKQAVNDTAALKTELFVMLSLIIIYLGITFGLPVPGCPKGYLGPGGKDAYGAYPNCTGGAAAYIDRQILGIEHIYQYPTAKYVYDCEAFDPEGVFGILLSNVQVFLGLITGMIILIHNRWESRIIRWMSWSVLLALLSSVLCLFSTNIGLIPINKNLWSLSFVFITSSIAFLVLSVLYFVIDVRCWWTGFPFQQSGRNAIILYIGHTLMQKMLPFHWKIGQMNTHFLCLLEAIWNTLLWIFVALYLDGQKWYYSL